MFQDQIESRCSQSPPRALTRPSTSTKELHDRTNACRMPRVVASARRYRRVTSLGRVNFM
jgi:hypothetical protein